LLKIAELEVQSVCMETKW